jgi:uncharacterized protein (TIGR03435 family)
MTKLPAVLLVLAVALATPLPNRAQSGAGPRLAFDVASIKPHLLTPGPFRSSTQVDPQGIRYSNVTLKSAIAQAYSVASYQIIGGPEWLASERYDILAKAVAPAPKPQLMLMLRTLLEERFGLRLHQETRELPIYALVVEKGGPKIRPVEDTGSTELGGGDDHQLAARQVSMEVLARTFSRQFGRQVIDLTGLHGVFDFNLDFAPDDAAPSNDGLAPSIFTAVQEQLGLRLEARKGPVEVVVIDHAEKPSQN